MATPSLRQPLLQNQHEQQQQHHLDSHDLVSSSHHSFPHHSAVSPQPQPHAQSLSTHPTPQQTLPSVTAAQQQHDDDDLHLDDHLHQAHNDAAAALPSYFLQNRSSWRACFHEASTQYKLALPMMVTSLLQSLYPIISLMFVGHLGDEELSGATLANSFSIVTGFTIMLGLASGLETLCGQAFGAKQYPMLGVYLQAAVISSCFLAVPISLLWLNMEAVFISLGQDKIISAVAGKYFKWLIPSLFANATLQPLLKFLISQSQVLPLTLCSLCAAAMHIPLCYILVYKSSLGLVGGALAVSTTCWLNFLFILFYLCISNALSDTWTGWSKEAISVIKPFLKVAVPSALMICLEYWSFEILVLISGLLTNPELETSVLGICVNTETLQYMLPFGLSAAASTRVANELGAGDPQAAKFSTHVVLRLSAIQSGVISAFFLSVHSVWGKVFSSDASVVHEVARMMPLLALTIFLDGIQGVLSGVARGCGWQHIGTYINFGSFYGFGMPLSLILALVFKLNSMGLWGGLTLGLLVQSSILLIVTLKINWSKMVSIFLDEVRKVFFHHLHGIWNVHM